MDDANRAAPGSELPRQGPHSAPPAFFPLKLLVQPSGSVLELMRPDLLIGRHSQADVRLPLPDVSRRHCRFLFSGGAWHIFDLNSLNGVFVNGEQVQHAILRNHDLVTIGGFQLEVDLSGRGSLPEDSPDPEAVIHRFSDSLPPTPSDLESQRRAS